MYSNNLAVLFIFSFINRNSSSRWYYGFFSYHSIHIFLMHLFIPRFFLPFIRVMKRLNVFSKMSFFWAEILFYLLNPIAITPYIFLIELKMLEMLSVRNDKFAFQNIHEATESYNAKLRQEKEVVLQVQLTKTIEKDLLLSKEHRTLNIEDLNCFPVFLSKPILCILNHRLFLHILLVDSIIQSRILRELEFLKQILDKITFL